MNDIDRHYVCKGDTVFIPYHGKVVKATFLDKDDDGCYHVQFEKYNGEVKDYVSKICFLRETQAITWLINRYHKVLQILKNRHMEVQHLRICANCLNCVKRVNNQGEWTKKWTCIVDNHRISNSHDLNTQCRDKDDFKPDWKDEIEEDYWDNDFLP